MGHNNNEYQYYMTSTETRIPLAKTAIEKDPGVNIDAHLSATFKSKLTMSIKSSGRSYEFFKDDSFKILFIAVVHPHLNAAMQYGFHATSK